MGTEKKQAFATRDNVFQACDELLKKGEYPTQAKIRKHLGGGSFASIGKYQPEWRKEREEDGTIRAGSAPTMPKEVSELAQQHYFETYKFTEQFITSERIEVLEAENEQLKIQLEDKEKKLVGYDEMKGRVGILEEQIERSNAKIADLSEQIGQFKQQLESINKKEPQLTPQSTNGHVVELSSRDWQYDVNPSED